MVFGVSVQILEKNDSRWVRDQESVLPKQKRPKPDIRETLI